MWFKENDIMSCQSRISSSTAILTRQPPPPPTHRTEEKINKNFRNLFSFLNPNPGVCMLIPVCCQRLAIYSGSSPVNHINDSLVIPQWIGLCKVTVCQCCLFRCCEDQKIMEDTSNNKTLSHIIFSVERNTTWSVFIDGILTELCLFILHGTKY